MIMWLISSSLFLWWGFKCVKGFWKHCIFVDARSVFSNINSLLSYFWKREVSKLNLVVWKSFGLKWCCFVLLLCKKHDIECELRGAIQWNKTKKFLLRLLCYNVFAFLNLEKIWQVENKNLCNLTSLFVQIDR